MATLTQVSTSSGGTWSTSIVGYDTDSTTSSRPTISSTSTITSNPYLVFNCSVPSGATVTAVSVSVKMSAGANNTTAYYALYNGTTSISSQGSTTSTSASVLTLNATSIPSTFTNLRLYIGCSNSQTNRRPYVYGAHVTITYNLPTYTITTSINGNGTISPSGSTTVDKGSNQTITITPTDYTSTVTATDNGSAVSLTSHTTYYTYTLSNISADHTIAATISEPTPRDTMYVKSSGTWKPCSEVYRKVSGVWQLVSDYTTLDPTKLWQKQELPVTTEYLCFTANTANSTVTMTAQGTPRTINLQYSMDGNSWNTFTVGSTIVTLSSIGDKVYFKGNNANGLAVDEENYNGFTLTGSVAASGDITTLISEVGNVLDLTSYGSNTFESLFYEETHLTTPPTFPPMILTDYCYHRMFQGCTNLTVSPNLPATSVAIGCYRSMLKESGVTTVTALPALTMYNGCYCSMYNGCSNLTQISALPATTLDTDCYAWMFINCSKIKMSSSKTGDYQTTYSFGATPSSSNSNGLFSGTGGSFTGTPTAKTYYTSNPVIG